MKQRTIGIIYLRSYVEKYNCEDYFRNYYTLMNIFYVDKDPVKVAKMMCDKHIIKMILSLLKCCVQQKEF